MTGDAGRTSLTTALWAQADSAPTKTISAVGDVVSDHTNDVEGLIVDLEAAILKTDDIMYETFVLDTGCSSMLCGVGVHSLLQNARHSAVRIRGFNGSQRVPGVQHGRLHMYAMSADRSFTGSAVDFGVDTVENLNHNH